MSSWLEGRVVARRGWTETLVSLTVDAPALTFQAGQFARLALPAPAGSPEPMVGRPYSFVNPPEAPQHEFLFVVVPGGPLSPRLAALDAGDAIWLGPRANGFFCVSEVPEAGTLWCLSTGTGLGPFLSILRTADPWSRFGRVVLVHAVRVAAELVYRDAIDGVLRDRAGAFTYVPVVSRETHAGALSGRIPALIADGRLAAAAGTTLDPARSRVMVCGNPAMTRELRELLGDRGFRTSRRAAPGQAAFEKYW